MQITDKTFFSTLAQIWLKMQMMGITQFSATWASGTCTFKLTLHLFSFYFPQWFQKTKSYNKKALHVNGKIKNRIRNALYQHNIHKPVNVCQSSSFIDHQIKIYNILWHTYNPTINIILTNTLKIICLDKLIQLLCTLHPNTAFRYWHTLYICTYFKSNSFLEGLADLQISQHKGESCSYTLFRIALINL